MRRIFWVAIAAMVLFTTLARLHSLHEPPERDITGYAYAAHQIVEGKTLYADVWDHKPPVTHYAFALFQLLFGYNDTAIYALGAFFTAVTLLFVGLIARELAGDAIAVVAIVLYGLMAQSLSTQSDQPNCEIIINAFKGLSLWVLLVSMRTGGRRGWVLVALAGLTIGIATAVKMTTGATLLVMLAALALAHPPDGSNWRLRLERVALFAVASAYVWIALIAGFALAGALGDFWDAVIVFNRSYAGSLFFNLWNYLTRPALFLSRWLTWEMGVVLGAVAFLGSLVVPEHRARKGLLVALLAAAVAEIAAPGKFYAHYYQLLVPFAVIASAWIGVEMVRSFRGWRSWTVAALLATAIAAPTAVHSSRYFSSTPEELSQIKYETDLHIVSKEAGLFLKERVRTGLTLFEWGAEPGLYVYSELDSNIPYFYYYPLVMGEASARMRRALRLDAILTSDPPDLFVDMLERLRHHGVPDNVNELSGVDRYLTENYTRYAAIGPFVIYCHNRHAVERGGTIICDIERAP